MTHLVFLLEEPSAAEMLEGLLPNILPEEVSFRLIPFEGKQNLEGQLERRIKHYRVPGARFIVLRDQDNGDCQSIKRKLTDICTKAGQASALVRIACQELECWYLADLAAVEKGLGLNGLARRHQKKYKSPDSLGAPSRILDTLTKGTYQKRAGSRAIGRYLDPSNTRSTSFKHLVAGIRRLAEAP